jgi:hypothetical protein
MSLPHRTICTRTYYTVFIKEEYFLELVITGSYDVGKILTVLPLLYISFLLMENITMFSLDYAEKHGNR